MHSKRFRGEGGLAIQTLDSRLYPCPYFYFPLIVLFICSASAKDSFLPPFLVPFLTGPLLFLQRRFWHGTSLTYSLYLVILTARFLGICYFRRDAFGAFTSRKCFSRLLVSCTAKTKHLSLKWLNINPGNIGVVKTNTQEVITCPVLR